MMIFVLLDAMLIFAGTGFFFCCSHLLDFCLLEHGGASQRRRQAGDSDFAGTGIIFAGIGYFFCFNNYWTFCC